MKKIISLLSVLFLLTGYILACEITATVQDDMKKPVYKTGDNVVVDVEVQFVHRDCPVNIKDTKFTYENLKIVGATAWEEKSPGLYVRQVKAVVTEDKEGDAKLFINRRCDKDGGQGVCVLKK